MPRLEVDKRFDPTGTARIRAGFVAECGKRVAKLRAGLTTIINEGDLFSLKGPNLYSTITGGRLEDKIFMLHNTLDTLIENAFAGPWTGVYVIAGYTKGYKDGLASARPSGGHNPRLNTLHVAAMGELQGITAALKQQVARVVTQGLQGGKNSITLSRMATAAIARVQQQRFAPFANTVIVDAHAHGKLDALEQRSIKRVGIVPEFRPARIARIQDARRRPAESEFQAVWVTAGDADVCPRCQEYEGQVMSIDQARGMIPLHANCRCTWEPVGDG
jgi:hypothetical protein